jgi:hypothetical protein
MRDDLLTLIVCYLKCSLANISDIGTTVCIMQFYMMKFVSDLQMDCVFLRVFRFPPQLKLTSNYNITEILLKVAINTITL